MSASAPSVTSPSAPNLSQKKAAWIFWCVAGGFCLLWLLLPTLFHDTYRSDTLEVVFICKEWVLATRKHPMLPAWLLEIISLATNRAFAAPFIAAQLCNLITLWAIWAVSRMALTQRMALAATFVMLPSWLFTVESSKFNQNITLLTLWALTIYLFLRAMQTQRMRWWLATGVALGLAFHAKYAAIFLVISILASMALTPHGRRCWKTPGPYLTTLVAAAIFLPHVIWMFQDGFSTIFYANPKRLETATFASHLYFPMLFLLCQTGYIMFSVLALTPILGFRWHIKPVSPESKTPQSDIKTLLLCCMGIPLALHVLISAITGAHLLAEYGAPFWLFFGTLTLLTFQAKDTPRAFRNSTLCVSFIMLLLVGTFFVQAFYSPMMMNSPRRFQFPAEELGLACDQIWNERYDGPCPYVTGNWMCAGYASLFMKDRPSVHFYYYDMNIPEIRPTGTWSEDADVNHRGGLVLWKVSPKETEQTAVGEIYVPPYVKMRFPEARVLPEYLLIPYSQFPNIPPERIGVAVVPPEKGA